MSLRLEARLRPAIIANGKRYRSDGIRIEFASLGFADGKNIKRQSFVIVNGARYRCVEYPKIVDRKSNRLMFIVNYCTEPVLKPSRSYEVQIKDYGLIEESITKSGKKPIVIVSGMRLRFNNIKLSLMPIGDGKCYPTGLIVDENEFDFESNPYFFIRESGRAVILCSGITECSK